ncbi:MAG: vWA domain-containing protein [Prolixibacteraceae bacterium]
MKNTIHYILILDQSGSMSDIKNEVILSFNEQVDMILKLIKKEPDSIIRLTLCTFNDSVEFKFIGRDIDQIKKLTEEDYHPDCCTALYDAIGTAFVKTTELSEPGDQVFFAIFTDGLENASKHYRAEDIKFKLDEAEKSGWNVKFFCRYEDKLFYQSRLNLSEKYVVGITLDKVGMEVMDNEIHFCMEKMVNKQRKQKP